MYGQEVNSSNLNIPYTDDDVEIVALNKIAINCS